MDHDTVHPVLGFREFDSKTEIDEFHGDPKCMKIQALLITERVLGQGHKDTIFRYMYAGAAHADSNDYTDCVSLWNYALKLKMEKETLLSCDTAFTARAIVQLYVNILIRHMKNPNPFESEPPLKFDDILTTSGYIRAGIDTAMELLKVKPTCQSQLDSFDIILTTWIHLVHILLQLAETGNFLSERFKRKKTLLQGSSCLCFSSGLLFLGSSPWHLPPGIILFLGSSCYWDPPVLGILLLVSSSYDPHPGILLLGFSWVHLISLS